MKTMECGPYPLVMALDAAGVTALIDFDAFAAMATGTRPKESPRQIT
jgi:hypothetical protein